MINIVDRPVIEYIINEERFDCVSKLGLAKANISKALKNLEISKEIKFLKKY